MAQLLSNLPIGAKVKFGKYSVNGEAAEPITWLVVAKNHSSTPAYPSNAITLLSEKIIDLRAFDAREPNNSNSERAERGNNRYGLSNIDQWLNKGSATWYSAQHSYDSEPSDSMTAYKTGYVTRPGFLNMFTTNEKNAILDTTIRVKKPPIDGGSYEDISRKVFLPSGTEIGATRQTDIIEGTKWAYFIGGSRGTSLTSQAYNNTLSTSKPEKESGLWLWWIRTHWDSSPVSGISVVTAGGDIVGYSAWDGSHGIRPALNLPSALSLSDTTDSEGCYTIVWNFAPESPDIISVPATVYGGKSNPISWSVASDPDDDAVTYQLECSVNNGDYIQIYSGASTTYAHLVPFGTTSVAYRVKATDPAGESSAYATSDTKTVVNNNAPVISGTDGNLGVKSSGFTGTYTITDANNNAVTVTEAIDGVQIRSLVATLGQAITYGVTENTWLALPNGSHTLTISATDGIDTTVRTYVFTKLVEEFTIQNATPWVSTTMPSRIMVVVTRNIPSTSTFKVEVCNNGYDASPTWENATDAVRSGMVHVFTNTTKTASDWGVLVRVTVNRNGATGACYVSAIGGNFE